MDNTVVCWPEGGTRPDYHTVWQWRILHAEKYSSCQEPFCQSKDIGLDFNVGARKHERLKSPLVSNGVILEVCDFARTVEKSQMHFIPNILENNFDLGLENDRQRMAFSTRIQHKLQDLVRNPPHCKHGVFPLFDSSSKTVCTNNGLYMTCREHQAGDDVKEQENTSEEAREDVEDNSHIEKSHMKDDDFSLPDVTEVKPDFPPLSSFTSCENIGLILSTGSKQTLDPGLLTTCVILELVDFARVLTGSFTSIVSSVLEHNFGPQSRQEKTLVWSLIAQLLKKRKQIATTSVKRNYEFLHEPFMFQKNYLKRAYVPALFSIEVLLSKHSKRRRLDLSSTQHEMVSSDSECITSGDIKREPEEKNLSEPADFCGDGEKCRIKTDTDSESHENEEALENLPNFQRNEPDKRDVDKEKIRLDANLWKLRSNRVKEILPSANKKILNVGRQNNVYVEFDLGFEPKQALSIDNLTHGVLIRTAQFALLMNSSQQEFIMHILENNFDLGLQSESHKKIFAFEVMKRVRELRNCEDNVKLSKEVFDLPCAESAVDVVVRTSTKSNTQHPQIGPASYSHAYVQTEFNVASESFSWSNVDIYPFCKDVGLMLHVDFCQPNEKLAIDKLTKGAMAEIANYAEKLCGSFEEICVDVLRHNFDLQGADSSFATTIFAQIGAINDFQSLSGSFSNKSIKCSLTDPSILKSGRTPGEARAQHDPRFLLWILRADRVQRILSVPHGDQCPFYSYSRCKKLGIDFNLGSGLPRNLDPRLLTNGVMVELYTFSNALSSSAKDFMTEILEYNLDLNFKGELDRSAFVKTFFKRSLHSGSQNSKVPSNSHFELPDLGCLEEDTPPCLKCYQDRNDILHQDKNGAHTISHCHPQATTVKMHADANGIKQRSPISTFPSAEMITAPYSLCKEAGFSLCVDREHPKAKMDVDTVTLEMLLDVFQFANKLCGKRKAIISDLLEHNFNLTQPHCENIENEFMQKMKSDVAELSWFNEAFDLQKVSPEKSVTQDCLPTLTECDIPKDSQPRLDATRLPTTGRSSISLINTELRPPSSSQLDEILTQEENTKGQTPNTTPHEVGTDQDASITEINMWPLRSNRVREILLLLQKEDDFQWGLGRNFVEFDIGLKPKQNCRAEHFTSCVLYEVACFALAMSSSQFEFILEILENNFDLGQRSRCAKERLALEVTQTVRKVKTCSREGKLSEEMLELPSFLLGGHENDGQEFPRDVVQTEAEPSQKNLDLHLYCKRIGLYLSASCCQPKKKLHLNKLTKEAMADVVNLAELLCGTFEQICIDVLRHNFDLDLQSADSDRARNILANVPLVIERRNVDRIFKPTQLGTSSYHITIDCHKTYAETRSTGPIVAIGNQSTKEHIHSEARNDPELLLWQLRTNHIQQLLSGPHREQCPFYPYARCKKLGVDFDVGSGQKLNLDPKLLTNGIMLELVTFSNSLMSSESDFLTEILEYNFDIKFDNQQQRRAFARKLKNQVSTTNCGRLTKPQMKRIFHLPDFSCIGDYTPFCPKCSHETNEPDCMLEDNPLSVSTLDSTDGEWMEQTPVTLPISTFPAAEVLTECHHCCREADLSLCVDKNHPRVKLDECKLTCEVIFDAYKFSQKLCGTKHKIVADVIQHNFNLDTRGSDRCPGMQFVNEMKLYDGEATWFDAVFYLNPIQKLEEQPSVQRNEMTETLREKQMNVERKMESTMPREQFAKEEEEEGGEWFPCQSDMCTSRSPEEFCYMCPLEEDIESETSDNNEDPSGKSTSADAPLTFTANTDMSAPFEGQLKESRLQDGDEARVRRLAPNECDPVQEVTLTETGMWKLRASRVKKILSVLDQEYMFFKMKSVHLDFDVGSQPKQKLSASCLGSRALYKTARLALELSASQREFIMDILGNNFSFRLQRNCNDKFFAREFMRRVRELTNSEDTVKYSDVMFDLPVEPVKKWNYQNIGSGETRPDATTDTTESVSGVAAPTLPADSLPEAALNFKDLYPFCHKIGLRLNKINPQPIDKLHINRLTNGAMTEIVNFSQRLCGTFEQTCIDVLRHNFDFDLQSADSDIARNILAQIPVAIDEINYHHSFKSVLSRSAYTLNTRKDWGNACSPGLAEASDCPRVSAPKDAEVQNDPNVLLWKLRANQIKQILTVPHEEQCPLYSFARCKKLGVDFNIASGRKCGFGRKLITNGIIVEIATFAEALVLSLDHFITEILEYNFDLNLNGELGRNALTKYIRDFLRTCKQRPQRRTFKWPEVRLLNKPPQCTKCYQVRNGIFPLGGSPGPASAGANGPKLEPEGAPLSSFRAAQMLTESYTHCKKIGINLVVDRDYPTTKLDPRVLTSLALKEVQSFARKLAGLKRKIINDVLEHNFLSPVLCVLEGDNPPSHFSYKLNEDAGQPGWFNGAPSMVPVYTAQGANQKKEMSAEETHERKIVLAERRRDMKEKKRQEAALRAEAGDRSSSKRPSGNLNTHRPHGEIGWNSDLSPQFTQKSLAGDVQAVLHFEEEEKEEEEEEEAETEGLQRVAPPPPRGAPDDNCLMAFWPDRDIPGVTFETDLMTEEEEYEYEFEDVTDEPFWYEWN